MCGVGGGGEGGNIAKGVGRRRWHCKGIWAADVLFFSHHSSNVKKGN